MEEKRLVDYFVVAGLPDDRQPLEEYTNEAALKPSHLWDPIIEIAVINKSLGEIAPPGFTCLEYTTTGFPADLNHGSLRAPEMYLCYKRGREKPPLTDIGVLYDGKERVMAGCEVLYKTPQWRPANVNNTSSSRIYITYRRADSNAASDTLAVTDICVILANKGESAPHAFCQINKTLNKGMMGSDIYLCYKKSMTKSHFLSYKPTMLDQFPLKDHNDVVLPPTVAMFCLPLGATIECWPAKANHPRPVFSTFVLTGANGQRMYGAAVQFYESFDREKLTDAEREHLGLQPVEKDSPGGSGDSVDDVKQIHQTKCICLLSHWPFFDTYKKFLSYIYKVSSTGPHQVPLERHISHFMMEVPFPSVHRPRILVQLNNEAVVLSQPEETPLPKSGASFTMMLKNLGPENCMRLLLYTQMEHKILIHSLRPAVLTSVAEASANMIFPFHWQCPYIPLCPLGLSEVLNAPCPFIVGIDSRYFDLYDPPPDVTCVDLDTNTVSVCDERKGFTTKVFPKKAAKLLKATLERLYEAAGSSETTPETLAPFEHDFAKKKKDLQMETAIQEAFLRFTAMLLKGYSNFLLPITKAPTLESTDLNSLFDVHGFLKSRERAYHKYFVNLMKTQSFSRFIEERSFVSDKDASLVFFDECIDRVDDPDDVRLIELDDNTNSERTVFISPPDPTGLPPGVTYSYAGFPKLNPDLFLTANELETEVHLKTPQRPRSPITKRSKQEMKSAQKMAQKHVTSPILWAKCLLGHCYSLWFIHLPSYLESSPSKLKILRVSFEVLIKMQEAKLQPPDELCYRVLMQLCGTHQQPALALKILQEMKRSGVHPNAMTYGYYNKAVLESKWPSENTRAQQYWSRLRNVIVAVSQFRRVLQKRQLSTSENDFDRISTDSFLDEFGDKTDSVTRDVAHTEPPNSEEKSSTGGMSDRGYNSMTLEDAKKMSVLIGSKSSLDSADHRKRVKMEIFHKDGCQKPPSGPVKQLFKSHSQGSHKVGTHDKPRHFEPIHLPDDSIGDSAADSSSSTIEGSTFDKCGVDSTSGDSQSQPDSSTVASASSVVEGDVQGNTEATQDTSSTDTEKSTCVDDQQSTQEGSTCTVSHSRDPGGAADVTSEAISAKKLTPSSNPTSPVHSIRVPVTDCEPLGVFSDPLLVSSSATSDSSHQGDVSTSTDSDRSKTGSGARRNLLIDLEPFGSAVRTRSAVSRMGVEGREMRKSNSTGRLQIESFSSSDTSSPGSPLEAWSPMSSGPPPDSVTSSPPTTRASTLPEKARTTGLVSMPSDKSVGRSESFSSALKSAASIFASKFTELKQSMATPTSTTRGSSQSLSGRPVKLHETEKLLSESDEDHLLARAASNDCLSSGALQTSVSSSLSSVKGASCEDLAPPMRGAVTAQYGHKPFVSDFLGGLMSMHLSPAIRGLATTWETVKDSMVESFSDSWGISDNSDYPYGWNGSDYIDDSEESSSDEKGSSCDQTDDSDRSSLRSLCKKLSGSLYSLPRTQHNVAMEVEICSLSRCHGCNGLLYDEQIMAGWTAEDSNLNTSCQYCGSKLVPSLQINIKDYRQTVRPAAIAPSQSCESMYSIQSMSNVRLGQSTATPAATTKSGNHGNDSQPAVNGDNQDCSSKTRTGSDVVEEKLVSDDSEEKVSCDDKVVANGDAKRPGDDTADKEAVQEGGISESEGVKTEQETTHEKLIDLSPVVESKQTPLSQDHIDVIIGDKLIDLSPVAESKNDSQCLETDIDTGDKLIDLSPITDSEQPAECLETNIDAMEGGTTSGMRMADWNPLLPPSGTSTPALVAPPSGVCMNGESSDVDLCDIEKKLEGSREGEGKTGKGGELLEDGTHLTSGNTEETSRTTSGNGTNDEQVSASAGDPGTEADNCKITGAVVDSTAGGSDKKDVNSSPGSEIDSYNKVDFGSRGVALDVVTVHYLSPLVLRKELENIIEHEGEECLNQARFVDDHPIIYWNLVWYFKRIEAPSHLPGFILTAELTNPAPQPHKTWLITDSQNVFVRAMWDNPLMHEGMGPPMYAQWNQATAQQPSSPSFDESPAMPRSLMQHIVSNIMCNDTMTPIKAILSERQRRKNKIRLTHGQMHSLYRDILFLSFVALGHNNIDHDAFDREFRTTYMSLSNRDLARTHFQDRPPKMNAILCRRLFSNLEL